MNYLFWINVLIMIAALNAQKLCPPTLENNADEAFTKIILYGDKNFRWGTTTDQVEKICKSIKNASKVVRKYLKTCLFGVQQQIIHLISKGASGQAKYLCKNKGSDSFKHEECGNSNIESDHVCMHNFVDRLKDATSNLPEDLKLGSSCCSFIQFENCILQRMSKEPKCSKENVDHFRNVVKSVAGEALELSCSDYFKGNLTKCDHINEKLKKAKRSNMKGTSILLPLALLIKSII